MPTPGAVKVHRTVPALLNFMTLARVVAVLNNEE